jgi:hypothetical protein
LYTDYVKKLKVKVNAQLPVPNGTAKADLFDAAKFRKIDEVAIKVGKPINTMLLWGTGFFFKTNLFHIL